MPPRKKPGKPPGKPVGKTPGRSAKAKKDKVTAKKPAGKVGAKSTAQSSLKTIGGAGASVVSEINIKTNMKPIGRSGTLISSGVVTDDHISALIGTSGQIIYEKMLRSDTQVNKVFSACVNPVVSAKWDVKPASDAPADVQAAALMKQIFFKDLPGGWKGKLEEILEFVFKGHAVFEVIHANKISKSMGPYTGLTNLAFRDQRTLVEWEFDPNTEEILRVNQKQAGDLEVDTWLDGSTLLIFFNKRKGADLGKALCRVLYGPYTRKLLIKQLQMIGLERSALPVPHLELPKDVAMNSAEAILAREQLIAFTGAEQAYFMTPFGWNLNYNATNGFDPSKCQVVLKAEDEEMAGVVVAMFLEMGIGGNSGNQAGVEGSIDFFNKVLAGVADKVCETINTHLIPQLCAMNFGDVLETFPELTHSGITADAGKELMEVVTGYVKAQVIIPDEGLEDHVRQAHNLPKKMAGEMVDNQAAEGAPPVEGDPAPPAPDDAPAAQGELELSEKDAKTPYKLIDLQGQRVAEAIKEALRYTAGKYISDVMNRYGSLSENNKQKAPGLVKPGGQAKMRQALRAELTATAVKALEQARTEVPTRKNVKLSNPEKFMLRLVEKFGNDMGDIKLNEFSKLPGHMQVLIAKQADLITKSSVEELTNKVAFQFSSMELKVSDPAMVKQAMETTASDYIERGTVPVKGANAAATVVNEGRDAFFFEPEVLEEIHSFTFTNPDPKTLVCRELTGTTFETNDAESLRFSPPLHHNCKSYLRANLKESKGVEKLSVSSLSPTAKAKEGITLCDHFS